MTRYRALIEYDGTAYNGYQRQRTGQPTIQGELERALAQLTGHPTTVTGSGRTDSGVHASGQVISFDLDWQHGEEALRRATNANLASDIVVLKVEETSPTFHPRFDARRRAYRYWLYNAPVRSPLHRRYFWHIRRPLDVDKMNEAAALLLGEHDFATFGQPPQGENTVRRVYDATWYRQDDCLYFNVEANAYLYRMVRSLVGSLKLVGEGSWTVERFREALRACDRQQCGTVAPPQGLYLVSVTY